MRQEGEGAATLSVADNGASLPVNGRGRSEGIGLDFIARLAEQLGGKLGVEAEPERRNLPRRHRFARGSLCNQKTDSLEAPAV